MSAGNDKLSGRRIVGVESGKGADVEVAYDAGGVGVIVPLRDPLLRLPAGGPPMYRLALTEAKAVKMR